MSNKNIQGVIPIKGKGFVTKFKGNYGPGEYRYLVNAEINSDGIIQQRRSVDAIDDWNLQYSPLVNPRQIVGFFGSYAVVSTESQHWAVDSLWVEPLWDMTNLVVPVSGYHHIISAFIYNDTYYWITLQFDPMGSVYTYYAISHPMTTFIAQGIAWAGCTQTALFTEPSTGPDPLTEPQNVFIHKDRLWIVTPNKIYYSKATDPTNFTAPDGGFFEIPDEEITGAAGIGDSIYFTCSNGFYVLSYAQDVSTDGYLRKLANIGGDSVCIHRSIPYFVSRNGEVYSVGGNTVDKVFDGRVEDPYPQGDNFKIVSFEEYLILIRRNFVQYSQTRTTDLGSTWFFHPADVDVYDTPYEYNVFWINTNNGSVHVMDFTDCNDLADENARGYIMDMAYNPAKGSASSRKLFVLTNREVVLDEDYRGNIYTISPFKGWFVLDMPRNSLGTTENYKPRIHVEIDSYVPDGNEYSVKKFRNLLLMAKLPSFDFEIAVCYDNQDFDTANHKHTVGHPSLSTGFERMHHPVRLPLNQRGRSISIRLKTTNPLVALTDPSVWDQFELSDIRVLWSYTQRLPEERVMPLDL